MQGMEVHTVVWGVERGGRITGAGRDRTKMGPLSSSDAVRCHACCWALTLLAVMHAVGL